MATQTLSDKIKNNREIKIIAALLDYEDRREGAGIYNTPDFVPEAPYVRKTRTRYTVPKKYLRK